MGRLPICFEPLAVACAVRQFVERCAVIFSSRGKLCHIHRAIAANKQVQFRYFDYDIRKSKRYFKKGAFYVVSPWRRSYADDNYYLLAFDEKAE